LIAATCDEEGSACGAPAMARWLGERRMVLDELIVAEPTGCAPVHGHRGVLRLTFDVQGRAAHSSKPHLGKNAVIAAAKLALAFEAERERLQSIASASPLGTASLTVTMFNGGLGMSVVPDRARLAIDHRAVTNERTADLAEAYRSLAVQHCPLPVEMHAVHMIDAFYQSPSSAWTCRMADWSGRRAEIVPYCTNAWAYRDVARECLVMGPGSIDQAHGAVEWVEIAELERLAGIFAHWWGVT
jgi:acetylornithine deacetylase/succinyl-diaminopimelate desuccinylase-like protein